MSYFCQFCDKELKLEPYVVYIKSYITCGSVACTAKAEQVSDELLDEYRAKTKEDNVIIFSTKTPDIEDSWQIVAANSHPEFLANHDIVAEMLEGKLYRDKTKTLKEMYYCAMLTKDIRFEQASSNAKT